MDSNNKGRVFDKCPGCGSTERYYETILKKLQDRGLIDKAIMCFNFQVQEGIPLPQEKIAVLPFGAEIPIFKTIWDICSNCGMMYAVLLEEGATKKTLDIAQRPPLNREERRRLEYKFQTNINKPLHS